MVYKAYIKKKKKKEKQDESRCPANLITSHLTLDKSIFFLTHNHLSTAHLKVWSSP